MEDKLNRVRVNIAGDEYTIKGDASNDKIKKISDYVNEKIAEAGSGITSKERYKLAILAAVNIAGDLFETQKDLSESTDKLDHFLYKAKELSEKIENVLET